MAKFICLDADYGECMKLLNVETIKVISIEPCFEHAESFDVRIVMMDGAQYYTVESMPKQVAMDELLFIYKQTQEGY